MTKRSDFGVNWEQVAANWLNGYPTLWPRERVLAALVTLQRLWPACAKRHLSTPITGCAEIDDVLICGEVLAVCEGLAGFSDLGTRLRGTKEEQGRSPYSEAEVADALIRLGYVPEFHAPCQEKRLDLRIVVEGVPVYIEVVTPNRSVEDTETQERVLYLQETLRQEFFGAQMRLLLDRLKAEDVQTIVDFIRTTPPSDATHVLPGIGTVEHQTLGSGLVRMEMEGGEVVYFPGGDDRSRDALPVIGFSSTDERIQAIIQGESKHFSESERNLVVVDAAAVLGFDMTPWLALMAGSFDPEPYPKIGGVALLRPWTMHCTPSPRFYRCGVQRNPYAYHPLPESLLSALASLDEPL